MDQEIEAGEDRQHIYEIGVYRINTREDEVNQWLRRDDKDEASHCLRYDDKDEVIHNLRYGDEGEANQCLKYGSLMSIVLKVTEVTRCPFQTSVSSHLLRSSRRIDVGSQCKYCNSNATQTTANSILFHFISH
jgi:hypothetical protein